MQRSPNAAIPLPPHPLSFPSVMMWVGEGRARVKANDEKALARGMEGLLVRLARVINRLFGRKGRVFADRYHVHVLRTPRQVRHALVYVLHNARKHGGRRGGRHVYAIDPCSSAAWFAGYADRECAHTLLGPPGTRAARSWLLSVGWRRAGLVRLADAPVGS
jgi:hypothetical protein